MAKSKAPRYDGISLEFFQQTWPYICLDYHAMILQGIEEGTLHEGITKGLISLIPKERDKADFNFWRPITLFTASYKIFAKVLLLPILRDVISPEQTAILSLKFILDNIVLTQEALSVVFTIQGKSREVDIVPWLQKLKERCIVVKPDWKPTSFIVDNDHTELNVIR
jgi:hypothetical protein